MPKAKAVTKVRRNNVGAPKKNLPDMDLKTKPKVVHTFSAAPVVVHNQPAKQTKPDRPPKAEQAPATLVNTNPWISKLTEQQRETITKALADPNGPSMRAIAREQGVSLASVSHLASKSDLDPARRLRIYGMRMRKRLPIPEKVEVYRAIALGELEGVRPADRLRALERADALEGIVTAREQRESESNQVHVGPLFILPAAASPTVDAVRIDVRPVQDKA